MLGGSFLIRLPPYYDLLGGTKMYEVKLPRLGQTMQSGTIINWLVDEGDFVTKGDIVFEMESEKSTIEVESYVSGVLKKILIDTDEEVSVGTVVALIGDENEEIDLSKYMENEEDEVAASV